MDYAYECDIRGIRDQVIRTNSSKLAAALLMEDYVVRRKPKRKQRIKKVWKIVPMRIDHEAP